VRLATPPGVLRIVETALEMQAEVESAAVDAAIMVATVADGALKLTRDQKTIQASQHRVNENP
jgi:hypothetical protein